MIDPSSPNDEGASSRIWTFGAVVLNERTLELSVEGQLADVERKSLQVLLHLLNHAGEVVTKDELIAAVWPGRILSDSVITSCIARLRDALRDDGQTIIKTVHGYGYRLIAPVKVEAAPETAPARFEFKPGEHLPARPLWSLVERLGTGGHGEAWLARHDKTRERRVYKFAADGEALHTLKREITIYRLLHDSLGERPDFVRLLDWNLEEPPYFLEYDYLEAGSLTSWAQAKGGIDRVPLETRVELAAQIADAVAAAHSVGVLHKDLKPGNVLVHEDEGGPRIRLCDFGAGGVVDTARLEALGITQQGFTRELRSDELSGSFLYLAPEVVAGQPSTVQADVYALGVMLYQLVAGDLRRPAASGWEADITDELLREDIAAAIAGRPHQRLADARLLAQRLRSLDQRRRDLLQQRAQQEEAARADRLRAELRRLRATAVTMALLAVLAVGGGVAAMHSRDAAREAAATTEAVNAFLNQDLLAAADPARGPTKDLTVRQLLDRAAGAVDERMDAQPAAAAQLHVTLGQAYAGVGEFEKARSHLEKAGALLGAIHGTASPERLTALLGLPSILNQLGRADEGCTLAREIRDNLAARLEPADARALKIRHLLAGCDLNSGRIDEALAEYRGIASDLEAAGRTADAQYVDARFGAASALFNRGDVAAAVGEGRRSVAASAELYGAAHLATTRHRAFLALCLIQSGQLEEAERELLRAIADQKQWVGDGAADIGTHTVLLALLRIEQERAAEAERAAREFLDSPLGRQVGSGYRPAALVILSEASLLQGRFEPAIQAARQAIEVSSKLGMPPETNEFYARANWADALVQEHKLDDAEAVLAALAPAALTSVPASHPGLAQVRRVRGRLALAHGRIDDARAELTASLNAYQSLYGQGHWRTRRAARELEAVGTR